MVDYVERKLRADEKPKQRYLYTVSGRGELPYDMLRHDCCWPASSSDAMRCSMRVMVDDEGVATPTRTIALMSYSSPCVERWKSFGWTVGSKGFAFS